MTHGNSGQDLFKYKQTLSGLDKIFIIYTRLARSDRRMFLPPGFQQRSSLTKLGRMVYYTATIDRLLYNAGVAGAGGIRSFLAQRQFARPERVC
ncbi:MAG TPA: hypothetical protein V6C63_08195 [Allocoleopsis sp.]